MHRGLPSWALFKSSLGLFRTLVRVLIQVSINKRDTLRSGSIRGHQFVITVEQIYRFYMHAEMILLQHDSMLQHISFLHCKVVVQYSMCLLWWSQLTLFSGQSFIEQFLNSLYFIKELCGLVSFLSLKHSMLSLFHNNKSTHVIVMKKNKVIHIPNFNVYGIKFSIYP